MAMIVMVAMVVAAFVAAAAAVLAYGPLLALVTAAAAYVMYYLRVLVSPIDLRLHPEPHTTPARLLERCSLLHGHYWPSPWVFSGHLDVRFRFLLFFDFLIL